MACVRTSSCRKVLAACTCEWRPQRYMSTNRLIPSATTWNVRDMVDKQSVQLTDDQVLHLAKLSHLRFTPGTASFDNIKRDISRLVSAVQSLNEALADVKLSPEAQKSMQAASAAASDVGLAEQRLAELRADVPPARPGRQAEAAAGNAASTAACTDELIGKAEEVLKHAKVRHGQYFLVPRVVDE